MKIKEVMILDLTSVSADTPIKEAVKIMSRQRMVTYHIFIFSYFLFLFQTISGT